MTTEDEFRRDLLIRKAASEQAIRRSSSLVKGSKRIIERSKCPMPSQNVDGNILPREPVDIRQASRELRASSQSTLEKSKNLRRKIANAANAREAAVDKSAA